MLTVVKRDENEFQDWLKTQAARAAGILEGWGMDPTDLLNTEIGWLLCLPKFNDHPLMFDLFQAGFLLHRGKFRCQNKARQIGFSFCIACEALARNHLKDRHVSVCVSYNLDDAKEKVALVKELHDELPLEFQKKMVIDSKTVVGFQSNNSKRRISKVISNPAKAPRGKSGDVYLDELAHCANDKAIYQGAVAVTARSGGQLTVGSTPLGQRGVFHGIYSDPKEYRGYWRQNVPWWLCRHFSKIADDADLCRLAWSLPTEVRVERYATQDLIDMFGAMPLEDFRQEFECEFQDERVAFFPYDLIEPCAQKELHEIPVYDNLRMLAMKAKDLGPLYAGFDVGRSKHPSELHIFDREGAVYSLRYQESFRNMPFPKQRERLFEIITTLRPFLKRFRIDETGLGKNLAEDLSAKFGGVIEPVTFTMPVKEELANGLKILMQERNIVLARCRSTIAQIHSIKQKLTTAGNSIFDSERNRHHHCYDAETEILTRSGWIRFPSLSSEDEVATLDECGFMNFERPSEVYHAPYVGPMICVDSKQVDLLVTPSHRMLVSPKRGRPYRFVPAQELLARPASGWIFKKDARWKAEDQSTVFSIGERTFGRTSFARFLGLYLSEGWCDDPVTSVNCRVFISQKRITESIRKAITDLGFKVSIESSSNDCERAYFYSKTLCEYLRPLGKLWEKRIPREILSWGRDSLIALIAGFMYGDGSVGGCGWTGWTTSSGLADDLQEALLRVGWSASIVRGEQSQNAWGNRPIYRVNVNRTRNRPLINDRSSRGKAYSSIHYEGTVHCCTVSSHLILVRRNGIPVWSGNSDKMWSIALAVKNKRARRQPTLVLTARTLGDSKKDKDAVATAPKLDRHASLVERLFTIPDSASHQANAQNDTFRGLLTHIGNETVEQTRQNLAVIKSTPEDALEARGRATLTAIAVWERSGDEERVAKLKANYRRIRRELSRRRSNS